MGPGLPENGCQAVQFMDESLCPRQVGSPLCSRLLHRPHVLSWSASCALSKDSGSQDLCHHQPNFRVCQMRSCMAACPARRAPASPAPANAIHLASSAWPDKAPCDRASWRMGRTQRPLCLRWRRFGPTAWARAWPTSTSAQSPPSSTTWCTSTPSASPSDTLLSSGGEPSHCDVQGQLGSCGHASCDHVGSPPTVMARVGSVAVVMRLVIRWAALSL